MRKSARQAEKQENLVNDARNEPIAKKHKFSNKTSKIVTMDNETMVEAFKYLDYCRLAKKSIVSKRFRDVIQTHRHSLPHLYVDMIRMELLADGSNKKRMEIFGANFSPKAYDEWIIRNNYSKQVPLESQVAGNENTHNDSDLYELLAVVNKGPFTFVLSGRTVLNHENWPLFQHFARLLSDPFVYIDNLYLSPQNDVLNLLAGAINPDHGRLRCKELYFDLRGNIPKFITWIKDHICCRKLVVSECFHPIHDRALLNFFLTGAHCSSVVDVYLYNLYGIIVDLVKKFMDFKKCDEYQLVQSIESTICQSDKKGSQAAQVLKRDYRKFIVKEEYDEDEEMTTYVFEFNNDDIGKKLQFKLTN